MRARVNDNAGTAPGRNTPEPAQCRRAPGPFMARAGVMGAKKIENYPARPPEALFLWRAFAYEAFLTDNPIHPARESGDPSAYAPLSRER